MKHKRIVTSFILVPFLFLALTNCRPTALVPASQGLKILAAETFLADIAQNVAGNRAKVDALMPLGLDPHAFEPTPKDVVKVAESNLLIINGTGVEPWLQNLLKNAGGQHMVVEASAGLTSRQAREGEAVEKPSSTGQPHDTGDPHFWLDPISVIHYVENIRDGFSQVDPTGKEIYAQNAGVYIQKLKDMDASIRKQVNLIPLERRMLVTNHESFGYFADRYGFKVIGTIIPSTSTDADPSAQQVAALVDHIRSTNAPAIFLETGTNPQLATQIAQETGAKVVTDLYTHSITGPEGKAPTYLDMIQYNAQVIVNALK
jgi:ABC-type Zn uptake system ZnuABC Zn-binding protein ZnuA